MFQKILFGWGLLMALSFTAAHAQFTLDGQLIQRSELRNGYNRLINETVEPAFFIAHRARLQAAYAMEGVSFFMSIQDVRTWGSTSQTKATDNFLSLHEAWVEAALGENWKIKLGRQELNYDNFRFLGNLDWALQARAHDFILVKHEKDNMKLHLGGGYNQDGQMNSGNIFTVPNQYKLAQFARYENRWGDFQFSVLFWNDGRQFLMRDVNGNITDESLRYRQTFGLPTLRYHMGNTTFSGFYYHQLGKTSTGERSNAWDFSGQVSHQVAGKSDRMFRITAGFEMLSGSPNNEPSDNRAFSPMYGTNHLFNGYMDLFYVGGSHENSVGLQDFYLKGRYDFGPKLFVQADGHLFYAQAGVYRPGVSGERMESYLGSEIDLSVGYLFNQAISLQGGYSHFFHTDTFEVIQNNGALKNTQNWAYLMLIFRPTMKNKFIGILL